MIRYAVALLHGQRLRLALTIAGVALCSVLMLFLVSIYRGVSEGSMEYIRSNRTDLWVLQQNSWNIFRCMSILTQAHGGLLKAIPAVDSVAPVLLTLPGIRAGSRDASIYLVGYEPGAMGGPPFLTAGRGIVRDGEIVLDQVFAKKYSTHTGDTVLIHGRPLLVVGLSGGTNAFVIQYAFVSLSTAQEIVGVNGIVSCFLVRLSSDASTGATVDLIRSEVPGVDVYQQEVFADNNQREMEAGFLPLLWTIAFIGAVVLGLLLSVLMSMHVIERRKEFAVLKALGAPGTYVPKVLIAQILLIVGLGSLAGVMCFIPLSFTLPLMAPEVTPIWSAVDFIAVSLAALIAGVVSSVPPLVKLCRIYALEAFQ